MNFRDRIYNLLASYNLSDLAIDFIEKLKTKPYKIIHPDFSENIHVVNSTKYYRDILNNSSYEIGNTLKDYDISANKYNLPNELLKINKNRKSERRYEEFISKKELFSLLKLSYFKIDDKDGRIRRNIASGGGTYPIEIFFINLNIREIEKGLFYYNLYEEKIQLIQEYSQEEVHNHIKRIYSTDLKKDIDYHNASAFIILKGLINRASFKYGDLGLKWAFIDSGAIIHNFYLNSIVLNIKCCACAGYVDSYIEEILGIDSIIHYVVSTIIVGK